jgi:hypothetical protein
MRNANDILTVVDNIKIELKGIILDGKNWVNLRRIRSGDGLS